MACTRNDIHLGTLVIVNDFDRPCDELIARVIGLRETTNGDEARCQYEDPDVCARHGGTLTVPLEEMTPIEWFGRKAVHVPGERPKTEIRGARGLPQATYRDGMPRKWQA